LSGTDESAALTAQPKRADEPDQVAQPGVADGYFPEPDEEKLVMEFCAR